MNSLFAKQTTFATIHCIWFFLAKHILLPDRSAQGRVLKYRPYVPLVNYQRKRF